MSTLTVALTRIAILRELKNKKSSLRVIGIVPTVGHANQLSNDLPSFHCAHSSTTFARMIPM